MHVLGAAMTRVATTDLTLISLTRPFPGFPLLRFRWVEWENERKPWGKANGANERWV